MDTCDNHQNLSMDRTPKNIVGTHTYRSNGLIALDYGWQYPAITEQHAFNKICEITKVPHGVTYIGYPWATLIDKIQTNASDVGVGLATFLEFIAQIPRNTECLTVCQHIKAREYLYLFEAAGISEVFWSHTTYSEYGKANNCSVRFRPFPLFPVQVPDPLEVRDFTTRKYLFSFVGAKSNKWYLTQARAWVIDLLANDPDGLIIARDKWHYQKIVYDHQIRQECDRDEEANTLVNQLASEQFKASLSDSIFSICPSGTGPNSIRLWESIASGTIPVIISDTYIPPGNMTLWQEAVVFCNENREAIQSLPFTLRNLSKDALKIEAMRRALQQLWTLYGPSCFIYDIAQWMLEYDLERALVSTRTGSPKNSPKLVDTLTRQNSLSNKESRLLIHWAGTQLLVRGGAALLDHTLQKAIQPAKERLPKQDLAVQQYNRILKHIETKNVRIQQCCSSLFGNPLKICLYGGHSNRTPLAYDTFRRALGTRVSFVENPLDADVIMTGFNKDLRDNLDILKQILRKRPAVKIYVVSEEPLWDSIWSGNFIDREQTIKNGSSTLPYTFLNHINSSIFDFTKIPYFLLTDNSYLLRYRLFLARWLGYSPEKMLTHWQNAAISVAYYAETRDKDIYSVRSPNHSLFGLSKYRTDVAKLTKGKSVIREGRGWHSKNRRQHLADWHLDKLTALDRRTCLVSGYENTHHPNYITEKIFDAFAVGAIPVYYAAPEHRIFTLIENNCMINTFNLDARQASNYISSFRPDKSFAELWIETVNQLYSLFCDKRAILVERRRVTDAVLAEISSDV